MLILSVDIEGDAYMWKEKNRRSSSTMSLSYIDQLCKLIQKDKSSFRDITDFSGDIAPDYLVIMEGS